MRVTKHLHSCLRVADGGQTLLFDPGRFSFVDGRQAPEAFADVDLVVLTHGHPDHLDPDALRSIVALSHASVVCNNGTADAVRDLGLEPTVLDEGEETIGAFTLQAVPAPHQPVLGEVPPPNTAFLVNGRLLNPGDSFADALDRFAGVEALVVPVLAPFLTELDVAAFVRRLRPAHVLPVHDGYAYPWFVWQRYDTYAPVLGEDGRTFHRLAEPGDGVEL